MRGSEGRRRLPPAPRPGSQYSPVQPSRAWGRRGRGRAVRAAARRSHGSAVACYQAGAANRRPQAARDGLWTPRSHFLPLSRRAQCNAACLSALRHKGTAILWLHWTCTKTPAAAAFPTPLPGNRGFPSATAKRKGRPSAAREGDFCLTSSFPCPPPPDPLSYVTTSS